MNSGTAEPLIPIRLNKNWYLISHSIFPIAQQKNVLPGSGVQFGVGDVLQDLFLSPDTKPNQLVWGIGTNFLVPTDTHPLLGYNKWALGPAGVAIKIKNSWTFFFLAAQLWSIKGTSQTPPVNLARVYPSIAYTTDDAVSYTIESNSVFNWNINKPSIPLTLSVAKVFNFGKVPISLGAGVNYFVTTFPGAPKNFGGMLTMAFLFPNAVA